MATNLQTALYEKSNKKSSPYAKDGRTKRDHYEKLRAALALERTPYEDLWRQLDRFVKPGSIRFNVTDARKPKSRASILDSTGCESLNVLESGMLSGMSSPALPWLELVPEDSDLAQYKPVQEWLADKTDWLLSMFHGTNLYTTFPTMYGGMGTFGTDCTAVLEANDALFRMHHFPIGSYYLGSNEYGVIDTFIRDFEMTVGDIVEQFGMQNVSVQVRDCYDRGDYWVWRPVTWVVTPNLEADPNRLEAKYMPFASCRYETGAATDEKFLNESGFLNFPFLTPRWFAHTEEIWGSDCPGMQALGDVKQLQSETRQKSKVIEKQVNPALQGPTSLKNQKVSLIAGDYTAHDDTQGKGIRPIHEVTSNIRDLVEDIREVQMRIKTAFKVPVFLMITDAVAGRDPTATEILERRQEKLTMLGPILGQSKSEIYDPFIDIVWSIADRQGAFQDAPEELQGARLRVNCISMVARAQQMEGISGLRRFLGDVVPLREQVPEIGYKINFFKAVDALAAGYGIDPDILYTDEEAQQAQQQAQQAAQAQAQAEQTAQYAQAGKNLATAPMDQNSALDAILHSAGA